MLGAAIVPEYQRAGLPVDAAGEVEAGRKVLVFENLLFVAKRQLRCENRSKNKFFE